GQQTQQTALARSRFPCDDSDAAGVHQKSRGGEVAFDGGKHLQVLGGDLLGERRRTQTKITEHLTMFHALCSSSAAIAREAASEASTCRRGAASVGGDSSASLSCTSCC